MTLLSWFDNRTLLTCLFLVAVVFAVQFLSLRRARPAFRGMGSVAFSLILGAPGLTLFYLHGFVSNFLSGTIASLLILGVFVFLYQGISQFLGDQRFPRLLLAVNAVSFAAICFFTQIRHNFLAGLAIVSLAAAFDRGLTALQLFKYTQGRTNMRLFGLTMAVYALISLWRAFSFVTWHRPLAQYVQLTITNSLPLAVNILFVCLTSLFFLSMVNYRVLAIVRNESEQDHLTGTLNRRGIEHRLNAEAKRFARSLGHLSVAIIDVDHFKAVNDIAGHAAGDAAIRRVASTISAPPYDSLGRVGGDEFILVLPQTSSDEAASVIDRIASATRALRWSYRDLPITLSVGLTEAIPGEPIAITLARADKALSAAKHAGRDCSRILLSDPSEAIRNLDPELVF